MHQIKIFKSIESELWNMEKEINQWLKETHAKVLHVAGNISPQTGSNQLQGFAASDVMVIVHYETEE